MPILLGILASSAEAAGAANSYDSIATVTGNTSSTITFSNISQDYKHLQLRCILRSDVSGYSTLNYTLRVGNGSIDSGSNYTYHRLYGNGSSASADGSANESGGLLFATASTAAANIFSTTVLDILDYTNTNKYKTMRSLSGADLNGSGNVFLQSFLWRSTSAINTMSFILGGAGVSTDSYSHFALYGIKGA